MTSPHGSTAICRQITPEMGWDREATAGPDPACRRAPSPGSLLLPALPTGIFPELCHAPTTGATCVGGQRKRGIFQCWKPRGKRLQDGTINAARVNHYSSSPPLQRRKLRGYGLPATQGQRGPRTRLGSCWQRTEPLLTFPRRDQGRRQQPMATGAGEGSPAGATSAPGCRETSSGTGRVLPGTEGPQTPRGAVSGGCLPPSRSTPSSGCPRQGRGAGGQPLQPPPRCGNRGRGAIAGRLREAGQDPEHRGFGQGKGWLCRMSQSSWEPGESWGCGGVWGLGFFSCRERRVRTFPLHSGSGWDSGNAMWPSTAMGRQHREIWPRRARPLSEIIPQEKKCRRQRRQKR